MTGAIKSFAKNIEGPKLVVLGDMRELGMYSHEAHKDCGSLRKVRFRRNLCGRRILRCSERDSRFYQSTEDLIKVWESESFKGKTVLLKGSRGMRMEQLVPLL